MDGFWPTFQRRSPAPPPVSPETACLPALRPDLPEKVLLPLQDAPATAYEALVQKDDQVTAGQKIGTMGTAPDNIGVHASVSGLVTDIALHPHPLGTPVMTITITTGEQEHTATCHFENTGKDGAAAFWRDMGIPLDFHSIRTCTTLLVNMTEIEPGLSAKQRIVTDDQAAFTQGLQLLLQLTDLEKAVIICEKGNEPLKHVLKKTVSQVPQATLQTVPRAYPDTVRVLLGLPHDPNHNDFSAGAAAQDACMVEPFVLAALHSAHSDGIPFIRQLITVTGSAVHTPQNMWVPCGSPLNYLIAQAGGNPGMHGRVSAGGPLMGLPQHRLDTPLLKTIHGLYCAAGLSFDEERKSRFYQRCACVRCAKCFDVCPAGVHPISITELIEHQRQDEAAVMGLNSCLECGLCAYVCPSQIPLTDLIITGKERLTDPAGSLLTGRYKTLI